MIEWGRKEVQFEMPTKFFSSRDCFLYRNARESTARYWGSSVAVTSLQYTRPHQDIMRWFVCSVCERENQFTKWLFFGEGGRDDLQSGGRSVNLREHKDAGRSSVCPGNWIQNNNKNGFCYLCPQCHPRANEERKELYDKGCDIRRMSKVIL